MKSLPKVGLYVSTNEQKPLRIYVTEITDVEEDEVFYLVYFVDEADKGNDFAMASEYDYEQWESLVEEYGLKFQD